MLIAEYFHNAVKVKASSKILSLKLLSNLFIKKIGLSPKMEECQRIKIKISRILIKIKKTMEI
jgi:hypothetical protein